MGTMARTKSDLTQDDMLPRFPPRFQCLNLSTRCILLGLKRQRLSSNIIPMNEKWRALDLTTKTFLEDAVAVLKKQCDYLTVKRHPSMPCLPSLTCTAPRSSQSTSITPPSSTLTMPLVVTVSEELTSPQERYRNTRRKEVAMSDDEIISLWNHAEPSVDGIDLHGCLGTGRDRQ